MLSEVQRETSVYECCKSADLLLLVTAGSSLCQPGEGRAGQAPSIATQGTWLKPQEATRDWDKCYLETNYENYILMCGKLETRFKKMW